MAKEEKSVIEQALLEAEQIDATFKANAKEILSQTMGSEIEEMVKESLEDSRIGINEDEDDDNLATDLELGDGDDELNLDIDLGDGDDELNLDGDNDDETEDLDLGDELGDIDSIDLTGADDTELISVFKKMGPDDEIEVVQDEDGVSFTDLETGAEYKVEFGGGDDLGDDLGDDELGGDLDVDLELGDDDMDDEEVIDLEGGDTLETDDEEEVVYEIEISEEEDDEVIDEDMDDDEDSMEEASRTLGSGKRWGKKGVNKPRSAPRHLKVESIEANDELINENKVLKENIESIKSENQELTENQEKMVDALKQFRQKLQEVAVFNSNLAHVVRLFTENATTKEEKVDIVKRMDEATTLKESKLMYKNIAKELNNNKKPIQESIDEQVNKTASSGTSQITESKVFVHPELEKMKNLWNFDYKY